MAGFKTFTAGEILTSADTNQFLMSQAIAVFDDATARDAAITDPVQGQFAFLKDDNELFFYDGVDWVDFESGLLSATVSATTGSPAEGTFTDANGITWEYYDFTGDGSITIDNEGFADCLVVGGGGGGSQDVFTVTNRAGGGAGAVRFGLQFLTAATHTITIGAGGAGLSTTGTTGVFATQGSVTTLGSVLRAGGGGPGAALSGSGFGTQSRSFAGGGGSPGGLSVSFTTNQNVDGSGAGGATDNYDGVSLNYNDSTIEFGRGGFSETVVANTGSGGLRTGGAGAAGRVIVKVLA